MHHRVSAEAKMDRDIIEAAGHLCIMTCIHLLKKNQTFKAEIRMGTSLKFRLHVLYVHSRRTWRVVLGDHNINSNEGREQYMSVSSVYIHPNWNSNNVAGG